MTNILFTYCGFYLCPRNGNIQSVSHLTTSKSQLNFINKLDIMKNNVPMPYASINGGSLLAL